MRIKKSELRIEKFTLLGINIICYTNDLEDNEVVELTNDEFNLDFDVFVKSEDERYFKIIIRLVNYDKILPEAGYGIDVSGEFLFKFDNKEELSEDKKQLLMSRSALPMAIAHIRSVIASTTSNFSLGSYYVPSIDLNHLFKAKRDSIEVENEMEIEGDVPNSLL